MHIESDASDAPENSTDEMRQALVTRLVPAAGPDFICIGMAKAGTGWLFDQLRYHPDFWLPPAKELAYLKQDKIRIKKAHRKRLKRLESGKRKNVKKIQRLANRRTDDTRDVEFLRELKKHEGEPLDFAHYIDLFRFKEGKLSGDISPGYVTLRPSTLVQLAATLPTTKVVFLVRDPVDRAWSRICMWHRQGEFDEDLLENADAFRDFIRSEKLARESFPIQVTENWRQNAPNVAFRTFLFDDIVTDPEKSRREILLYLGADPEKSSGDLLAGYNKKANSAKLELKNPARDVLVEHFKDELSACGTVFGGAARDWGARYGV